MQPSHKRIVQREIGQRNQGYAGQGKAQLIKKALGNSRFVWNKLPEMNMELYRKKMKFRIDERRLVLPKVGWVMEGDLNASMNMLKRVLKLIASSVRHIEHMREMVSMRRRTSSALAQKVCQTNDNSKIDGLKLR